MRSLRSRVIVLVISVATLSTLLSAWLVTRSAQEALREQQATTLETSAAIYQALADYGAGHRDWSAVADLVTRLAEEHHTRIALVDADGHRVADTEPDTALPARSARLDPLVPVVYFSDTENTVASTGRAELLPATGARARQIAHCLRSRGTTRDQAPRQQVAECTEQVQRARTADPVRLHLGSDAQLDGILGVAGWQRPLAIALAILALAGVLGWWLGRRLTRPLTELAGVAERLEAGDLHERSTSVGTDEVGRLGVAVNAMADSVQRTSEQRSRLISDVAHELGNPLVTIGGTIEAMQDGIYPTNPAVLASLAEEVGHVNGLVRDLADLARADSEGWTLHSEEFAMRALCDAVATSMTPLAPEVRLTVTGPADLTVVADPSRIRQILVNLVGNALRHTPAGGRVEIAVRRGDAPGAVSVTVADTGDGIAADDLDAVFERFWRADEARTRAAGGSGLGLAIGRELARAHGGDLTVTSMLGQGATFTLTLP